VFAPDGRWIAYHSPPRGASPLTTSSGVFVDHFLTGSGYRRQYNATSARLVADGNELFYVGSTATGQLDAAPVTTGRLRFRNADALSIRAPRWQIVRRPAFDALPGGRLVRLVANDTRMEQDGDWRCAILTGSRLAHRAGQLSCTDRLRAHTPRFRVSAGPGRRDFGRVVLDRPRCLR
jgi:hypothetical protein